MRRSSLFRLFFIAAASALTACSSEAPRKEPSAAAVIVTNASVSIAAVNATSPIPINEAALRSARESASRFAETTEVYHENNVGGSSKRSIVQIKANLQQSFETAYHGKSFAPEDAALIDKAIEHLYHNLAVHELINHKRASSMIAIPGYIRDYFKAASHDSTIGPEDNDLILQAEADAVEKDSLENRLERFKARVDFKSAEEVQNSADALKSLCLVPSCAEIVRQIDPAAKHICASFAERELSHVERLNRAKSLIPGDAQNIERTFIKIREYNAASDIKISEARVNQAEAGAYTVLVERELKKRENTIIAFDMQSTLDFKAEIETFFPKVSPEDVALFTERLRALELNVQMRIMNDKKSTSNDTPCTPQALVRTGTGLAFAICRN